MISYAVDPIYHRAPQDEWPYPAFMRLPKRTIDGARIHVGHFADHAPLFLYITAQRQG